MPIKATKLRQNLYQYLDKVLESGKPLEIERGGKILRIVPTENKSKFDFLESHKTILGEPEDLLGLDWSSFWNEGEQKLKKVRKVSKTKKSKKKSIR